ncbi:hypothetical protein P9112_003376 [Eukaryota sp. TZLM1-RC]
MSHFILVGLLLLLAVSAVDVSVMLPLDLVNNRGELAYPETEILDWFYKLTNASITNVMSDVWWGLTEPQPRQYNFNPYINLLQIAQKAGVKVQFVTSFHRCGGNVGDTCDIPLPQWVLDTGKQNPDIWYTDQHGHRDEEYISLGVDNEKIFGAPARSPVEIYADWVEALVKRTRPFLWTTLTEFQLGVDPVENSDILRINWIAGSSVVLASSSAMINTCWRD